MEPTERSSEQVEEAGPGAGTEGAPQEEAMLFCPLCSRRLLALRCKLFCEQCGYFMSCADYY